MLTNEDINKIIEAQREVFTTKEEFADGMRKSFSDLQTAIQMEY